MYDHAVFSLYSLSFMSLLIVMCALLGWRHEAFAVTLLLFCRRAHVACSCGKPIAGLFPPVAHGDAARDRRTASCCSCVHPVMSLR